jgi:hypothetical protein
LYPTDTVVATGDGTSGVYIFGAQLESGTSVSTYEPTDTLTPSANANIAGYNSAAYTMSYDIRRDVAATSSVEALEVSDLTTANRALVYVTASNTLAVYSATVGGVSQGITTLSALGIARGKLAVSMEVNNVKAGVNGVTDTGDTGFTMPTGLLMLHIGASYSGTVQLNGFIYRVQLIPTALTQAQLDGLTT